MTELMKPLGPAAVAPFRTTRDGDALDGDPLDAHALDGAAQASVRELLAELATLEDATRAAGAKGRDRLAALAREQEIIDELHRRCPESPSQA